MSELIKISHSSANLYLTCSYKYKLQRIDRITSISKNASLYFGSAVDEAIQCYLKDFIDGTTEHSIWKEVFEKHWRKGHDGRRVVSIYDSVNVNFGYKDYDAELLTPPDILLAKQSLNELLPDFKGDWQEAMDYVTTRKKQRAHVHFSDNEHRYFNRLSWMSMYRKGVIMVEAFIKDFAPKIKKVLAIQKKVQLTSDQGDVLTGYVDFVLDIEDLGTVIFDLKTSAQLYDEQLKILTSQQLGIYCSLLGPELNTRRVGFVVLVKNIKKNKIKICKSCGHKGLGSHKTCDAKVIKPYDEQSPHTINAKTERCNGEWDIQIEPEGVCQILTEELTDANMNAVLETVGGITDAIKAGIFVRNFNSCSDFDGCEYLNLCFKGSMKGLVQDNN